MSTDDAGLRVDVWLWRARMFKTRSLATAVVNKGQVRLTSNGVTRRLGKASALVRAGDTLTLPWNKQILHLRVVALGERRGPASEARELYEIVDDDTTSLRNS